jgi:TolB-like protein/tetratricopeptide (TPR) repeat protein
MFLDEQATLETAPGRLKIVIMPFENLGPPEHAYFADGVTEEITSRLAAVGSLGVISRKSAVQYARSDKTTRQIGEELGVSYVLAGTVRWAPGLEGRDRVKICPQLVRVADDTHVWARTYDQVIDDIFDVQASIARRVVQQLGIALQGTEHAAVEIRPTESLDAYHAFLRGLHHASQPHFTRSNWERVLENFERAVAIDPDFAGAWSKLAMAHARYYYYQADTSDARKKKAREAADRAMRLAPEAAETHMALGYYYHWVERDRERALEEFALAEHGLPSDADVLHARGTLLQAMGRWAEAQEMLERAHALSPRDAAMTADLVFLYYPTHQYEKAMEFSDRIIDLAPGGNAQAWGYLGRTFVHWSWKGALPEARMALEKVPLDHDFALWAWFWQEMYEGRYRQALEHLELAPEGWIRNKIVARPAALLKGLAWDAMGDAGRSRAAYESAHATLEEALAKDPDDPRLHSSLGIALAALGQEEDAIREGARAVDLYPLSRDAFYGIPYVLDMAHIYTLAGKHDAACERLEMLLSVPSWLSPVILEIDPRWDRLRDQHRFQRLLGGPGPE